MRTGITGLFLLILFAACNGPDKPAGALLADTKPAPCKASSRISTITKEDVYDLSGYAHISRISPFNLFDEAAVSDPKDRLGTEFSNIATSHQGHQPVFQRWREAASWLICARCTKYRRSIATTVRIPQTAYGSIPAICKTGNSKAAFTTKRQSWVLGLAQVRDQRQHAVPDVPLQQPRCRDNRSRRSMDAR